jgi:hypothetical protein
LGSRWLKEGGIRAHILGWDIITGRYISIASFASLFLANSWFRTPMLGRYIPIALCILISCQYLILHPDSRLRPDSNTLHPNSKVLCTDTGHIHPDSRVIHPNSRQMHPNCSLCIPIPCQFPIPHPNSLPIPNSACRFPANSLPSPDSASQFHS